MMTYAALVTPYFPLFIQADETAEKRNPYHILTERHIQAMWLEQKYFKFLKTHQNEPIHVLSPGIWNSEAGPDFLKAHIKIGEKELRGDIEIHLSQEGWYQHGHHKDPNYDNVILHVCYWETQKILLAKTSSGKEISAAYLQPHLTIPETRIVKLIDLDLYPYKVFVGTGTCSSMLFHSLEKDKTADLFHSAAIWRLNKKVERLHYKINPSQNILQAGIAMALGYKHNAEAFYDIFNDIQTQGIKEEKEILVRALGLSGFFNSYFREKWNQSNYYLELCETFNLLNYPTSTIPLKLDKIRPANHPVRRLALLAKIMSDPNIYEIESRLSDLWDSHWQLKEKNSWKYLKESFFALFPHYEDAYWTHHYTFETNNQKRPIALMGDDLRKEILVNVCFPLLYLKIESRNSENEKLAFANFYNSIPASKTKKSVYLNHRFFGHKAQKINTTEMQQGAYQIHRDFCIHFEASCQGCPFVDRYKQLNKAEVEEG